MNTSSREAKQEGGTSETNKLTKTTLTPSSSRPWSAYRNPRIVRVSRAFGGKDRHSKVCTVRGLRDRRIRLSVQTAIQLYDLQDKLGLNQPSKVIDWLIDVTKEDIEKLPPLPMLPGFGQFHYPFNHPLFLPNEASQSQLSSTNAPNPFFDVNGIGGFHNSLGIKINGGYQMDTNHVAKSRYNWNQEIEGPVMTMRGSKNEKETEIFGDKKGKWPMRVNEEQENQENRISNFNVGGGGQSISAQLFFPMVSSSSANNNTTHSSLPSLLHNSMPFNSSYHLNLNHNSNSGSNSHLSLSQFSSHGFATQAENSLTNNNMSINVLSLPNPSISAGPQLFFCPPMSIPSLFAPYTMNSNSMESESREINHLQLLSNSTTKPLSTLHSKDVDTDS